MEVGRKVICIDDSIKLEFAFEVNKYFKNWVKKGVIYTVREYLDNDGIVDAILLEEVVNGIVYQKLLGREQEPAFGLFRFAEIEEEYSKEEIEEEMYERI